jgi:predicted nuclease of predicted toxin-antitoxin system
MAFRIKADENMPRTVAQVLREHSYDAVNVIEQQMGGWKDPDLWRAIQEEKRFLITADKGFADVRIFPPGSHAGILLLRPDEDGIRPLVDSLAGPIPRRSAA